MSLTQISRRLSSSRQRHQQERALARALANAPTPASRQELLLLVDRGAS